tara:strand:- start:15595 stop:15789 length:195 start_codon:yes stop_codon:yes gene_type:complete
MTEARPDINTAAGKAKEIVADGVKVTRHGLKDLIEADEYLAGRDAVKRKNRGLQISPIGLGGTQ